MQWHTGSVGCVGGVSTADFWYTNHRLAVYEIVAVFQLPVSGVSTADAVDAVDAIGR